jgi:hypothetical protein
MQQVTLQQFETAVKSHPGDDVLDVVFFITDGCHQCTPFMQNMQGIAADGVNFFVVNLQEPPPLFAISAVPSMTVFQRGHKLMETTCSERVSKGTIESLLINITEGSIPGPSML